MAPSAGSDAAGQTRTLPAHLKYAVLAAELPPEQKRTPSMLVAELKGTTRLPAALKRPRIVQLFNMSEFTHNVESVVPLDEPLFQPSPPEVVFDAFEAHSKYTATLRFRNNDSVNRLVSVWQPPAAWQVCLFMLLLWASAQACPAQGRRLPPTPCPCPRGLAAARVSL